MAVLGSACHDSSSSGPSQASSAAPSASAGPVASAQTPAPSASTVRPPPALCRAASLSGVAELTSLRGEPLTPSVLAPSSDIPEDAWVTLDPAATLTAKHPVSTRETTFVGPGEVRTCVARGEEAWLARGKFESVVGSGERPGPGQWVVTPVGVLRYGAAKVEMTVGTGKAGEATADIKVSSGTAFAWTGDEAGPVSPPASKAKEAGPAGDTEEGWTRVEGPATVTLRAKKAASPEAFAVTAVDRCVADAKAARGFSVAVGTPDASLAQLAPRQVVARHLARAACAVAFVRVDTLPASPRRDELATLVGNAEATWKTRSRHTLRH